MQQSAKVCALALVLCAAAPAQVTGTAPISFALSSSPNPSAVGQAVTLTAGPTTGCGTFCSLPGIMTFYDGNTALGTATETFASFVLVTTKLLPGAHSLSASYSGDSFYAASKSSSISQTALAFQITTSSPLPNGLVGSPYSVTFATNAVAGSFTWTVSTGTVPPGLSQNSGGVLSGTPTQAGVTTFTATASGLGAIASATFSITVTASPARPTSFLLKTIAGGYAPGTGYSGDGGLALQAQLFDPVSVAVDGLGNVFVADQGNNCVRRVTPNGVISTFAGTGAQGFSGDGGPATSAQLNGPQAVAVDTLGHLYIADSNTRIRVVNSTGTISTLAAGFSYVFALAVDSANNLYVSDSGAGMIFKVSPSGAINHIAGIGGARGYGGDGGQAANAQFNGNEGVAFYNPTSTLFIADTGNQRVRAISPAGVIQTVVGTGTPAFGGDAGLGVSAQLNSPSGVALDAAGNLYIADSGNNRIRMLTPAGLISTVGGILNVLHEPLPDNFASGS